jgi:hypothetical protein
VENKGGGFKEEINEIASKKEVMLLCPKVAS